MCKILMLLMTVVLASVSSEPLLFSAPWVAAPAIRSALVAPGAAAGISPALAPAAIAPGAFAPAAVAPATLTPYSSVSSYVYGSAYSTQDYLVSPSAPLTYGAYSLPYAYAADWFYRR